MKEAGVEDPTLQLIYDTSESHKRIAAVSSQMWKQKTGGPDGAGQFRAEDLPRHSRQSGIRRGPFRRPVVPLQGSDRQRNHTSGISGDARLRRLILRGGRPGGCLAGRSRGRLSQHLSRLSGRGRLDRRPGAAEILDESCIRDLHPALALGLEPAARQIHRASRAALQKGVSHSYRLCAAADSSDALRAELPGSGTKRSSWRKPIMTSIANGSAEKAPHSRIFPMWVARPMSAPAGGRPIHRMVRVPYAVSSEERLPRGMP